MTKLPFYTRENHPKNKGQDLHIEYEPDYLEVIRKDGTKELEEVGQTNIYEQIQSYAEQCKIENILHAAAMGDLSAFNQRETTYADATTLPKSLMEAQNLVLRMKQEFETMPLEVREIFNNSPEMYVNMMGTEEFNQKMAPYNKKIADIEKAGSMKEYQKKVAEAAQFNKDVRAAEGGSEQ